MKKLIKLDATEVLIYNRMNAYFKKDGKIYRGRWKGIPRGTFTIIEETIEEVGEIVNTNTDVCTARYHGDGAWPARDRLASNTPRATNST